MDRHIPADSDESLGIIVVDLVQPHLDGIRCSVCLFVLTLCAVRLSSRHLSKDFLEVHLGPVRDKVTDRHGQQFLATVAKIIYRSKIHVSEIPLSVVEVYFVGCVVENRSQPFLAPFQFAFLSLSVCDVDCSSGDGVFVTVAKRNAVQSCFDPLLSSDGVLNTELLFYWPISFLDHLLVNVSFEIVSVVRMDMTQPGKGIFAGLLWCDTVHGLYCRIDVQRFFVICADLEERFSN
nr:hypothetical protein [Halovenus aranensis]